MHIYRRTFFPKEQQKNFKFFLRRNIECTSLQYFDLIDRVNAAMQGLSGTGFTSFQLTASATNHNHGELMENIERWQTRAVDATAERPQQSVTLSTMEIIDRV